MILTGAVPLAAMVAGVVPTVSHELEPVTELSVRDPPPEFEIVSVCVDAAGAEVRPVNESRLEPTLTCAGAVVTASETAIVCLLPLQIAEVQVTVTVPE